MIANSEDVGEDQNDTVTILSQHKYLLFSINGQYDCYCHGFYFLTYPQRPNVPWGAGIVYYMVS